ncbi:MAG: hypothetical protein WA477_07845 [Candidatus Sulfotelmatobacter sp.]
MPARYVILKERRLVVSLGWGRLSFADFRLQQDALTQDPDFDPAFDQLVDVSEATSLALSIEEAKTIATRGIFKPTSKRAVIAINPEVFGMGRMMDVYHAMATGRDKVRIFYDRESALRWLGLESLPPV